ncbi:hypothetical protein HK097_000603 [Rhizophlyctis rosea]|uniref:NADH-ubiquinone oxidoreductase 21kDa subunit N-terminal domain-containing protein n=1 Tax=Rhizophlyctis rosea TaxID=64517 RepID=A0AAD5WYR8_9FUNG|nr:hypothetical protein HK097_000603 [Rhizophlyctis rosea]
MVRWVDNLPDDDHVPYKFIEREPHVKDVVRYMRSSDYLQWAGVAFGFPIAHWTWERYSPSFHPKVMPRVMAVQIPFFMFAGFLYASGSSLRRFWGWTENAAEYKRWQEEAPLREARDKGKGVGWAATGDW